MKRPLVLLLLAIVVALPGCSPAAPLSQAGEAPPDPEPTSASVPKQGPAEGNMTPPQDEVLEKVAPIFYAASGTPITQDEVATARTYFEALNGKEIKEWWGWVAEVTPSQAALDDYVKDNGVPYSGSFEAYVNVIDKAYRSSVRIRLTGLTLGQASLFKAWGGTGRAEPDGSIQRAVFSGRIVSVFTDGQLRIEAEVAVQTIEPLD